MSDKSELSGEKTPFDTMLEINDRLAAMLIELQTNATSAVELQSTVIEGYQADAKFWREFAETLMEENAILRARLGLTSEDDALLPGNLKRGD